jgi:hypothetical protein
MEYEILMAMDDDDTKTITTMKEFCKNRPHTRIFVSMRHGYKNLHAYYNFLGTKASGELLWLWNDDALMTLTNWDGVLESDLKIRNLTEDSVFVGHPIAKGHPPSYNVFPIISKKLFDIMGHFSLSAHNDSYVQTLAQYAGCLAPFKNVYALHDLKAQNDSNYVETRSILRHTKMHHFEVMWSQEFLDVINKVRVHLGKTPLTQRLNIPNPLLAPKKPPAIKKLPPPLKPKPKAKPKAKPKTKHKKLKILLKMGKRRKVAKKAKKRPKKPKSRKITASVKRRRR